ncbi:beta-lactamase-like protein [Xylariaceae sp. FL0255]|nr:beta-lactamase-like protein [Xylariaceae sp. FL0255]
MPQERTFRFLIRLTRSYLRMRSCRVCVSGSLKSIHRPQLRSLSKLMIFKQFGHSQPRPITALAAVNSTRSFEDRTPSALTSRATTQTSTPRNFATSSLTVNMNSYPAPRPDIMHSKEPFIHDVFHNESGTWQYLIVDPSSSAAAIVDPVLDFNPATRVISTKAANSLLSLIVESGYHIDRILETHVHADHLTAAFYLQRRLAEVQGFTPPIGIGKRVDQVQALFGARYGVPPEEYQCVFDKLFDDDEAFQIGTLDITAIHLPGHTPDHMGYKVGDNVFCGDSLFIADIGTARCDFPGGSARDLYTSAKKLLSFSDDVKIWTGHDYPSDSRGQPMSWMSVKEHKERNRHVMTSITEEQFLAIRNGRDAGLNEPKLLHQSLQVNLRGGRLPKPNATGERLLHLPLVVKEVSSLNL